LLSRSAAILSLLKAKAMQWPSKVGKGQERIIGQLIKAARDRGHSAISGCRLGNDSVPFCDYGIILSRRF
jgi:hypothetical protein